MKINPLNINYLWSQLIVEELIRNSVDYFCLAPGSRSSPLAYAVGMHPKVKSLVHFDERGLGFNALGYVAATKRPAAIITTSGTAVANLFPAVIEASKKKLPLIILTADRPPELRFTGANQTIDQVKIFGEYTRWAFDIPCPTQEIAAEAVLTTIDQAVYRAQGRPPGPVHLNCMFREPLAPVKTRENFARYLKPLNRWIKNNQPYTRYTTNVTMLSEDAAYEAANRINHIKNGLIIAGKLAGPKDRDAVLKLSERLNWPIFADITSGLRLGTAHKNVIHYYDQILVSDRARRRLPVDGIIHLGGRMTSKRLSEFLSERRPAEYLMVLNHPLRNDPAHQVSLRVESSAADFFKRIEKQIKPRPAPPHLKTLQSANETIDKHLNDHLSKEEKLTEPAMARLISEYIPQDSGLFIGNSLPIREMDMFATPAEKAVPVTANRGASGIDGNIATAYGFAAGLNQAVTVLIGDLALLHDLNSLAMRHDAKFPLVIVVLNNQGGGVFSFLPIAESNPVLFERFWGTPHSFRFDQAARMFHYHYSAPQTPQEFIHAFEHAHESHTATIIEIRTDRNENLAIHRHLQAMIRKII